MKKIKCFYEYYYYRLYIFHRDEYLGGGRVPHRGAILQIIIWQLMNFITIDRLVLKLNLTHQPHSNLFVIIFPVLFILHLIYFNNNERKAWLDKKYGDKRDRVKSLIIKIYVVLTPLLFILSFLL